MNEDEEQVPSKLFCWAFPLIFGACFLAVIILWGPGGVLSPNGWYSNPHMTPKEMARSVDETIAYGSGAYLPFVILGVLLCPTVWRIWDSWRKNQSKH